MLVTICHCSEYTKYSIDSRQVIKCITCELINYFRPPRHFKHEQNSCNSIHNSPLNGVGEIYSTTQYQNLSLYSKMVIIIEFNHVNFAPGNNGYILAHHNVSIQKFLKLIQPIGPGRLHILWHDYIPIPIDPIPPEIEGKRTYMLNQIPYKHIDIYIYFFLSNPHTQTNTCVRPIKIPLGTTLGRRPATTVKWVTNIADSGLRVIEHAGGTNERAFEM